MRVILSFLLSIVGLVFQAAHATDPPVILILGDSLSAGFGMDAEDSWVHLLEIRLQEQGHSYRILNSSVSGDTTQGGLTRLPRLLDRYQPEIVIIELGGNDGLRGINPDVTRKNMTLMIQKSRQSGAQVLLAGIKLPPNYGAAYLEQFESMYADLAGEYDTLLVPFFMDGVVFTPGLLQADGIHPNENGQPVLLDNVWRVLEPALLADTTQEIDHLLGFVASSPCEFERNGSIHNGPEARDHMTMKYEHHRAKVRTAEDFIKYSATRSMMSGKKYKIYCPDSETVDASNWLLTELRDYRKRQER